jgi:hypothetical protein
MYPGSKAPDGMSRLPRKDAEGVHYDLVLTTSDSPKRVIDFYTTQLKVRPAASEDGSMLVGKTPKGNDALISVAAEGGQTVVRIRALAYQR